MLVLRGRMVLGGRDTMDEEGHAQWRSWRFELTAHGKYIELSFDRVRLADAADVERWDLELEGALDHYRRPVDMLLDLRGIEVAGQIAEACRERLDELLRRHAASLAYFGADPSTDAALAPTLMAHGGGRGGPDRDIALARLMERRRARRAARARELGSGPASMPGVPLSMRVFEESGALPL